MKKAYFAAGCFWCITPSFYEIPGVRKVTAGYSGGQELNPTYEQVKGQQTGHRETICIDYNEIICDYAVLLEVYLNNIDPFDEGGQFIDRGRSYTLAVYYSDASEKEKADALLRKFAEQEGRSCAVAVEPFCTFWTAEDYHQDYFRTHPDEFARELEESGRMRRRQG